MSEPFLGEIRMVGFNFAPRGFAFCDGQLLAISTNNALFALLGTTFGGDGRTTFALPDLRGRIALHPGSGPGLPSYSLGQRGGAPTKTLNSNELPAHTHAAAATTTVNTDVTIHCQSGAGTTNNPTGAVNALDPSGFTADYNPVRNAEMAPTAATAVSSAETNVTIGNAGNGQSFSIQNPFCGIYHVIALVGIFPSRS
jgi:microcystin-dependent protein